eukprot:TRINITY_DN6449_c0_g4_i1.p1 TRINITY_DN6449_c0_g4~~TRINITY_DN6449_c0_g4_i1.p1  ORF type:complete len:694 (+),score=212.48 TRINITY_DN6449_c0_g4_i1:85-2082(+)
MAACEHDFSADPPQKSRLIIPISCLYCGKWMWGTTAELWECVLCGGCCHKRCVPAPIRLAVLRRDRPSGAVPRPVVLRPQPGDSPATAARRADPRDPTPGCLDADAALHELVADWAEAGGYDDIEREAEAGIDFAFPADRDGAARRQRARRGKHDVPTGPIFAVFRDMFHGDGSRRSLSGVSWSVRDLRSLAALHHRRYLRRLAAGELVREAAETEALTHAFRYARGAYGNGKLHHSVLLDRSELDPGAYMDEALALLGWGGPKGRTRGRMLRWSWLPQGEGYHTPGYFVGVDLELRCGVIGIRGTQFTSDIYIDVNGTPSAFLGGHVHHGILEAATAMWREVRPEVLAKFLPGGTGDYAGWPVVAAGHSLGGGVAACLSLLMEQEGVAAKLQLRCYGFGVPPCFCPALARRCDRMAVIVNGKDLAPRAGLAAWDLLEREVRMPNGLWGAHHTLAGVAAAVVVLVRSVPPPLQRRRHSVRMQPRPEPAPDTPTEVALAGEAQGSPVQGGAAGDAAHREKAGVELGLPGTLYVLHLAERDPDEAGIVPVLRRAEKLEPFLFRLPSSCLGGVCISPQMLSAHPWRSYWTSITRLYDRWSSEAQAALEKEAEQGAQRRWSWFAPVPATAQCGPRPKAAPQQQQQQQTQQGRSTPEGDAKPARNASATS